MRKDIINYQDWEALERPGYFGKRRDEIIGDYDRRFGADGWSLFWCVRGQPKMDFARACQAYYEESYLAFLRDNPDVLDQVCQYHDVIDNAPSNTLSGTDYNKQEASATHIQDIAIRNAIQKLRRRFHGPRGKILVVRGEETEGFKLGLNPGHVPFGQGSWIILPSIRPAWAAAGSIEDFWGSNKYVCLPKDR